MAARYPAAMHGYYTTVTPMAFTPGVHSSDEQQSVMQPSPGRIPPTAGHWHRESIDAPRKPKPRLTATPTGGKVVRKKGVAQYPRKRKSTGGKQELSAAQVHALWSRGKLDF